MTQSTLEQRLRRAAEQNARLLEKLSNTDYAVSAYQQSLNYVAILKKQLSTEEAKVKDLDHLMLHEYPDHVKNQDSMVKHLHRTGEKEENFNNQATSEQKEWLSAVQRQVVAKSGLEQLKINLACAEKVQDEFKNVAGLCGVAQLELDEIHCQLFDGPTPIVPGEEEIVNSVWRADSDFNIVQLLLSTEEQAAAILQDAAEVLDRAIDNLDMALQAPTRELLGVSALAAVARDSTLSRAQSNVWQAEMLLRQAQKVQPEVGRIGGKDITQQDFLTDILFDNTIGDLDMRKKLRNCQNRLAEAQGVLGAEINAAGARQIKVQAELEQSRKVLEGKRQELHLIRTAEFERLLEEVSVVTDAPTTYQTQSTVYAIRV